MTLHDRLMVDVGVFSGGLHFLHNVREHGPSPAGAHSETGVEVQTAQDDSGKAAGDGCVARLVRCSSSSIRECKHVLKRGDDITGVFIVATTSAVSLFGAMTCGLVAAQESIKSPLAELGQVPTENSGLTRNVIGSGRGMSDLMTNHGEKSLSGMIELDAPISPQGEPMTDNYSDSGANGGPQSKQEWVSDNFFEILLYQVLVFLFFVCCGANWFRPARHHRENSSTNVIAHLRVQMKQ